MASANFRPSLALNDTPKEFVKQGLLFISVEQSKYSGRGGTPRKLATRKIQIFDHDDNPNTLIPTATAGLNAPPEMSPTAKAPVSTVNPMARP